MRGLFNNPNFALTCSRKNWCSGGCHLSSARLWRGLVDVLVRIELDECSKPRGTDLPPGCIIQNGGVGQRVVKSGNVGVQLLQLLSTARGFNHPLHDSAHVRALFGADRPHVFRRTSRKSDRHSFLALWADGSACPLTLCMTL